MDGSTALFKMREVEECQSRLCEVLLQLASAQEQLGNESAAFTALEEALHIGSAEGNAPAFLDEAKGVRDLISRWLDRIAGSSHPAAPFAAQLLSLHTGGANLKAPPTANTAIGRRERQILGLLNQGLTNAELANRCRLSEGTVKWYLHNLYEKLGVGNRTSLLHAVREQGLAFH